MLKLSFKILAVGAINPPQSPAIHDGGEITTATGRRPLLIHHPQKHVFLIEFEGFYVKKYLCSRVDAPTVGISLLKLRGFYTEEYWYWICIGALLGFAFLFNALFIAALTYLDLGPAEMQWRAYSMC